MDPEVLEMVASATLQPRPQAGHRRRERKRVKAAHTAFDEDVIILTDDDEVHGNADNRLQPGPSMPKRLHAEPLFLPDSDEPPRFANGVVDQEPPLLAPDMPDVELDPRAITGNEDSVDDYVARILEIIPDVQPSHVLELITQHLPTSKEGVVEQVLHILFEDPTYPKVVKGKGKRKREEGDDGSAEGEIDQAASAEVDYGSNKRARTVGMHYIDVALEQLFRDFPLIPRAHIRKQFAQLGGFYAPTYLFLDAERKSGHLPYKLKQSTSRSADKGKGVAKQDIEFDKERAWLLRKIQEDAAPKDAQVAEQLTEIEYEDGGEGIECGCCFTTYPFERMVQCPEAHLFCASCVSTYASTLLGSHDANLVCMDQSGCKLPFPESELRRFLTPKLLELYERVKQRKEIEAAGLENLEECPFCEYKVVIDNDQEKLFRCENSECSAISCRSCKKPDHLPKSCEEAEKDKHLDARHAIEEAMTRALMRNCPKCQKGFVKETGCNKMVCPNCQTMSCYICRQVIKGYDHFNQQPNGQPNGKNKCQLWDPVEQRHADEVTAAAKKAMEAYKLAHPEVDDVDIKVDLPPPVAGPSNIPGQVRPANALLQNPYHAIPYPHAARHMPPPPQMPALPLHHQFGFNAIPRPDFQFVPMPAIPENLAHVGMGPAAPLGLPFIHGHRRPQVPAAAAAVQAHQRNVDALARMRTRMAAAPRPPPRQRVPRATRKAR